MPGLKTKQSMPSPEVALKGRMTAMPVPDRHFVLGSPLAPPFPAHCALALFGLGCFWGAERKYWQLSGVYSTSVGYVAGLTPNPTYEEVCSGLTGHNEVVRVVFAPGQIQFSELLKVFWEAHNPTQGMRQGNDVGTQYRSAVYVYDDAQMATAIDSRDGFQRVLKAAGYGAITTEVMVAPKYYYAEAYHQQYLAKNPGGYCGLGGTGVTCG
ncbi:MAG: peptide-methionine (S)-S-oxide reductase MsrA [Gammaproteobacteria bacterium]|nr:peptide-methionine (S)-S-oxide reductase MsrA [Gammaproteobacteria bacterium]